MLRLFVSTATVALLSSAALAADLPVYEPAPMVAPTPIAYNWSGFYIGPQGGYGWGDFDVDDSAGLNESIETDGGFVGGVVGAQWQWNWAVLGIEAEGNYSMIEGDESGPGIAGTIESELDWFGSVGGKLGFAWDRFMIYGTGGAAFAKYETGQTLGAASSSDEQTFLGWQAGAGVDFAVTDNVIIGAQYRHYDFGNEDFDLDGPFTDREGEADLDTISGHVTLKFGGLAGL